MTFLRIVNSSLITAKDDMVSHLRPAPDTVSKYIGITDVPSRIHARRSDRRILVHFTPFYRLLFISLAKHVPGHSRPQPVIGQSLLSVTLFPRVISLHTLSFTHHL